ncbi:unnamed protein product, partial [Laminaria digitata]
MWRKKLLSHLSMFGCREAVAPRAVPILVSDEGVLPSELKQRHTKTEIADATRAWAILVEGVALSWATKCSKRDHRVAAGESSRTGMSQEELRDKTFGSPNLRASVWK